MTSPAASASPPETPVQKTTAATIAEILGKKCFGHVNHCECTGSVQTVRGEGDHTRGLAFHEEQKRYTPSARYLGVYQGMQCVKTYLVPISVLVARSY